MSYGHDDCCPYPAYPCCCSMAELEMKLPDAKFITENITIDQRFVFEQKIKQLEAHLRIAVEALKQHHYPCRNLFDADTKTRKGEPLPLCSNCQALEKINGVGKQEESK